MEYFGDEIDILDDYNEYDYSDLTEEEIGFALAHTPELIKPYTTPAYLYLLYCTLEAMPDEYADVGSGRQLLVLKSLENLAQRRENWCSEDLLSFFAIYAGTIDYFRMFDTDIPKRVKLEAQQVRKRIWVHLSERLIGWERESEPEVHCPPLFDRHTLSFISASPPTTGTKPSLQATPTQPTTMGIKPSLQPTPTQPSPAEAAVEEQLLQQQAEDVQEGNSPLANRYRLRRSSQQKPNDEPKAQVTKSVVTIPCSVGYTVGTPPQRQCTCCLRLLSKSDFASRQWSSESRRCKGCTSVSSRRAPLTHS